jgi:hypothetical protein
MSCFPVGPQALRRKSNAANRVVRLRKDNGNSRLSQMIDLTVKPLLPTNVLKKFLTPTLAESDSYSAWNSQV